MGKRHNRNRENAGSLKPLAAEWPASLAVRCNRRFPMLTRSDSTVPDVSQRLEETRFRHREIGISGFGDGADDSCAERIGWRRKAWPEIAPNRNSSNSTNEEKWAGDGGISGRQNTKRE